MIILHDEWDSISTVPIMEPFPPSCSVSRSLPLPLADMPNAGYNAGPGNCLYLVIPSSEMKQTKNYDKVKYFIETRRKGQWTRITPGYDTEDKARESIKNKGRWQLSEEEYEAVRIVKVHHVDQIWEQPITKFPIENKPAKEVYELKAPFYKQLINHFMNVNYKKGKK